MTRNALINKIEASYNAKLAALKVKHQEELQNRKDEKESELRAVISNYRKKREAEIEKFHQNKVSELRVLLQQDLDELQEKIIDQVLEDALSTFSSRIHDDPDFASSYYDRLIELVSGLEYDIITLEYPLAMENWIKQNPITMMIDLIPVDGMIGMKCYSHDVIIEISPISLIEQHEKEFRLYIRDLLRR